MITPLERSPYGLIQEDFRNDPWKLLICCMLLNMTSIKQVRPIIDGFFQLYPDAEAASRADEGLLATLLRPLGLYNRRSKAIIRFSELFALGKWNDVKELPGIGAYAADSYAIFIDGNLDVDPSDKKLKVYKEWALGRTYATGNQMHQDS